MRTALRTAALVLVGVVLASGCVHPRTGEIIGDLEVLSGRLVATPTASGEQYAIDGVKVVPADDEAREMLAGHKGRRVRLDGRYVSAQPGVTSGMNERRTFRARSVRPAN